MAVSPAPSVRRNRGVSVLKSNPSRSQASALDHAVRLIYRVCCLAGSADLIEQTRNENGGAAIRSAIRGHDTAALYDWLMSALSYQGISDRVAYEYMERHGQATWSDLEYRLARPVNCPKLKSYWHFHDCRYDKTSRTCAEPYHIDQCPLPTYHLRNGRLNQTAYSLYLFIRDIADGDLAGWIDSRLIDADDPTVVGRLGRMREALIVPLRQVYGVADKVLTMALSCILLAAPKNRPHWIEVGGSMIAIDTLVHNFLHRTGVLRRFDADHLYGAACYRPNGCADIILAVAGQIDARDFNQAFPKTFPRFVQHAIWRYCAQSGLDICNGNRLDDRKSCSNIYCRLYSSCDRIALVNVDI
jgi:hypothetical protein